MSSLVFQVIWQRYLSILVGSEASSATMVISIFLLGMSLGYYFFGKLSKIVLERKKLLKIYGYTELVTGAYAICFPMIFKLIFNSTIFSTNNFFINLALTLVLLLPPTFLMGATVPVMTAVLPNKNSFVNRGHAIIYGVNTLGAFVGVILGGLFLVHKFGLDMTMTLVGSINLLVSLIYIFNGLNGNIVKNDEFEIIPQELKNKELYLYAFLSGAGVLGLEIIWIRLLGLTIGSSLVVFPLVLGVFILGIGLASLSLKKMTPEGLRENLLYAQIALFINFVLAPFLPRMAMLLRVTMSDMTYNFYLYYILCFIFMCAFLLPVIVPLGRILPLTYSYLIKNKEDFGTKCGLLYSFNTLGTLFGSIVLGYLLLHLIDVESVFKIIVVIISFGTIYVGLKKNHKATVSISICLSLLCVLMQWKRDDQLRGLFRYSIAKTIRSTNNLESVKKIEVGKNSLKQYFFEDGVGATVAVVGTPTNQGETKSIMVNGKSDSSTIGDYSTISMLALLPVLYNQKKSTLNTAVVGLGTGVTAGLLGALNNVDSVDVCEISPEVIKSQKIFKKENYDLVNNTKVKISEIDAFNFFKGKNDLYDIVVSEPTNPWTVGVENLFTSQFYRRVKKSMTENGVFIQWLQGYSTNRKIFTGVISRINEEFGHAIVYKTHELDYAVMASRVPLKPQQIKELAEQSVVRNILSKLKMKSLIEFLIHKKFNSEDVKILSQTNHGFDHDLFSPKLSVESLKSFFFGKELNVETVVNPYITRLGRVKQRKIDLDSSRLKEIVKDPCVEDTNIYMNLHCKNNKTLFAYYRFIKNEGSTWQKIRDYSVLRKYNHIPKDLSLVLKALAEFRGDREKIEFAFNELLKEGNSSLASKFIEENKDVLSQRFRNHLTNQLTRISNLQSKYLSLGSR